MLYKIEPATSLEKRLDTRAEDVARVDVDYVRDDDHGVTSAVRDGRRSYAPRSHAVASRTGTGDRFEAADG